MRCIADVNVLLPLLCGGHVAEKSAYRWFDTKDRESIGWCLPIRLAILRHLSNRHIMGTSVLAPTQALDTWARLEADQRLYEIESLPGGLEMYLRLNVRNRNPSPQIWIDAWLAAVAESSGLQIVSFDRDFERFDLTSLEILTV